MATIAAHGAASSLDDDAHACPICRETFVDAFSTLCGHTFCFACINRHLEHGSTCPCCSQPLSSDSLFPNLALDKLLRDLSRSGQIPGAGVSSPRDGAGSPAGFGFAGASARNRASELADALTDLPLEQLTPLLRVIADKHKRLVMDDKQVSMHVLRDFLALSHRRKNEAVDALEREIGCIDDDLEWVERQVAELGGSRALDAFAQEASLETDPRELARRRALGGGAGGRAGQNQTSPAESDARNAAAASSAVAANHAATMVCEMLSAWGIDSRGGAGPRRRAGAKPPREPRGPPRFPRRRRAGEQAELDGHDARRGAEQARRERERVAGGAPANAEQRLGRVILRFGRQRAGRGRGVDAAWKRRF